MAAAVVRRGWVMVGWCPVASGDDCSLAEAYASGFFLFPLCRLDAEADASSVCAMFRAMFFVQVVLLE